MAKIVESKTVVGLEIGTSKVVAVVGEVLPDGVVNVLGVGSSPSKGIDKGSITDLNAVITSIQRAVEAAESVADCQIISVTLAITGDHIQSLNESGFVPIAEGEVTQEEIDSAMHTASSVKMGEGLSLLHIIPQEYAVDKQMNIKDPLGLQGVRKNNPRLPLISGMTSHSLFPKSAATVGYSFEQLVEKILELSV